MGLQINEYQKKAHETADYPVPCCVQHAMPWDYPVHALAEEAGEVEGKFAKAIRDEDGFISVERKEAIVKELGDVLWFVAEICTDLNVTLEDVMQKNLEKLASRKARNVIHGEGDNR